VIRILSRLDLTRPLAVPLLALALLAGVQGGGAWADPPTPVYAVDGVALRGIDPVAYFTEGRPIAGNSRHALMWRGVIWHFATPENLQRFEMNPRAYAPQYGGYCAGAAAAGELAPSDPASFVIHDGRLFLLGSEGERQDWIRQLESGIHAADARWPALAPD